MGEAAINRFINSRVLTWLTAVVGIVAAYAMLLFFGTPSVPPVEGLFGGGLDHLLPSGILSWAVNMVVVFVAAVMLNWLNKTYVFIREHTMMFVTVFLCATLSNPVVSTSLGTPTLLALALVVCTYVMFGTFQQRDSQSVAFLITMILTVCAMQSFVFALYIPVFIVGFSRCASSRCARCSPCLWASWCPCGRPWRLDGSTRRRCACPTCLAA